MYSSVIHTSPRICALINRIRSKSQQELEFQKELHKLVGVMDMILGFTESTMASGNVDALRT